LHIFGKEVSEAELDFILDGRKRHDILRHFLGDLPEIEIEEYGRRKDEFFQQIALDVKPIPGVLDFIAELRRRAITLAIATSASKTRTRFTLKRLHLTDQFAVVVTGDDVDDGKPNPAIYSLVCRQLKSDPRNSVGVEDAVSGVRAAKKAGLKCIGVGNSAYGDKLRAAGADHVIENFLGLEVNNLQLVLEGPA